jgi:hypothetical protein
VPRVLPAACDLRVGFVEEPAATDTVTRRSGGVDELSREGPQPPVQGDVIDVDATFDQQVLDIPVGQPITQVLAHRATAIT